jgi:hypothetical protein
VTSRCAKTPMPRVTGAFLVAALLLQGSGEIASASKGAESDPGVLSVPAEFVSSFRLPGIEDHIRRPSALFVDHTHGEVLVGDSAFNRLVIFDESGIYRYEFSFTDQVGSVVSLAVDSSGFVYVLGTSREGRRVLKYDFDGVFLDEVRIAGVDSRTLESLTVDDEDRIIVIDVQGICTVAEPGGAAVLSFDTMGDLSDTDAREVVRGTPRAHRGLLYVPASSLGSVLVFELDSGRALPSIGFKGNTPGQFNFPVDVDILPSGIVVVLDKMRFNVLCFSPSGRFLGEFGGKGYRDGWMYHPTLLAAISEDQVIVGQVLDHRVQVLRVPEFVFERLPREPEPDRREGTDVKGAGGPGTDPRSP